MTSLSDHPEKQTWLGWEGDLSDYPEIQTWLGWEGDLAVRPPGDTDMVGVGR